MKMFILSLSFSLLICNYVVGQHFVKEGLVLTRVHTPMFSPDYENESISFQNQTEFNNHIYLNVYLSFTSDSTGWQKIGYIREDQESKVFFYNLNTETERMVYDFDPNIGDTLTFSKNSGTNECKVIIANIDSIYTYGGVKRKRITVNRAIPSFPSGYEDYWIDGFGSLIDPLVDNLLYFCYTDYYWIGVTCIHDNGILIYQAPWADKCYLSTINHSNIGLNVKLFPNPANNIINVASEFEGMINFQLFDQSGRFLKEGFFSVKDDNTISVKDLQKGSYFILFQTNDKRQSIMQFVKN